MENLTSKDKEQILYGSYGKIGGFVVRVLDKIQNYLSFEYPNPNDYDPLCGDWQDNKYKQLELDYGKSDTEE